MELTEIGQIIYEQIIEPKEILGEIIKAFKRGKGADGKHEMLYASVVKAAINSLDENHVKHECFYLLIFLTTYCAQKQFSDLGNERTRQILDSIHQCIDERMFRIDRRGNFRNEIKVRFNQYYKAIRTDIQCLGQPDTILLRDLTARFFENLLGRQINFSEFGASRLLFGTYAAELISLLSDNIAKLRENYVI
jgi:methyl coenzyme M reductase subunit C-like uncharacterized protein (methanogenesis marker protein 7)